MFQHQLMVTGQIRFALYSVHNQHLRFLAWRRHQLNMSRETCTTKSYYSGCRHTVNNLFRIQYTTAHQSRSRINLIQPQVAFHINEDSRNTYSPTVYETVNLIDHSAKRRVHISAHKAAGFSNQLTGTHFLTFLHNRNGRCTDMLYQRNNRLLRQRTINNRLVSTVLLIILRMNTAYSKCIHNLLSFRR